MFLRWNTRRLALPEETGAISAVVIHHASSLQHPPPPRPSFNLPRVMRCPWVCIAGQGRRTPHCSFQTLTGIWARPTLGVSTRASPPISTRYQMDQMGIPSSLKRLFHLPWWHSYEKKGLRHGCCCDAEREGYIYIFLPQYNLPNKTVMCYFHTRQPLDRDKCFANFPASSKASCGWRELRMRDEDAAIVKEPDRRHNTKNRLLLVEQVCGACQK